jgi:Tfp pilus assembly protein PilF
LALIERFDAPLAQATTGSLDALYAYSLALDHGRLEPRLEAVPHLQRAIEIDPNFAMAMALLSGVYHNNGRSAEAPRYSRRAFELRDKVSERERFFISWRYYVDAEQAWDKALDLGLSWTKTYPRESFAFNSLGVASAAFGQHEQATAAFREALRLDPQFLPPRGNLAGSLIALNRFDDAKVLIEEQITRGGEAAGVRRTAYVLALVRNDSEALARELEVVRRTSRAMWAPVLEARTAAFSGQMQAAHDGYQRAVKAAITDRFHELGAQWTMEDAELHAVAGQCDEARREIAAGLALNRDNFTLERAGRAQALCGGAEATDTSDELATRFPAAALTNRIHRPVIAAALAVKEGDFRRALTLLDPVVPYDHAPAAEFWPAYLRGKAYLGLGDAVAAAEQFHSIMERRGKAPMSPLYALAHGGAARAAALTGEKAEARTLYGKFFALWSRSDDDRLMNETRREYASIK